MDRQISSNDDLQGNNGEQDSKDDNDSDSVASVDTNGVRQRFYHMYDFDEDVLEDLKDNISEVDSMIIGNHNNCNPLSIDWAREVCALSKNTHLKCVEISYQTNKRDNYAERNAKALYKALSGIRSIKYLSITGYLVRGMDMGRVFSYLTPCFQNNLCSLIVSDITLDSRTMQLLSSAMEKCNQNLKHFGLNHCEGMNGEVMSTIVNILPANPQIEEIELQGYDMDEEAVVLGSALCSTVSLKKLSLRGDLERDTIASISIRGMESISKCLAESNSLEELDLRYNNTGVEGGIALAEALLDNSQLKVLDIHASVSPYGEEWIMSADGWRYFFESMQNCGLQKLCLGGNTISDEEVAIMVEALNTMDALTDLNLLQSCRITSSGWVQFFNLLRSPGSVFEKLTHLNIVNMSDEENQLNDEGVTAFAKALIGNTSLQGCATYNFKEVTLEGGWAALSHTLCDKSSIENICNSNHTLEKLGMGKICNGVPDCINSLLEINRSVNKAAVARQKIFRYYYADGKHLNEIANLDVEVLPRVLARIGEDAIGIGLFYQVVRIIPALFETTGKVSVGGKRKRGTKQ